MLKILHASCDDHALHLNLQHFENHIPACSTTVSLELHLYEVTCAIVIWFDIGAGVLYLG